MDATALVLSDLHYPFADQAYISIATKLIKQLQPDHLIQLGDALDFSAISSYLKEVGHESRIEDELAQYNSQLDKWQKIMKRGSYFRQLEGNHSARLAKYIAKHCRDLHGIVGTIPELLRFKERSLASNIKYVWHPYNKWDSCRIGDVYFHHGFYFDKNVAANNLTRYGVKFVQGHAHRYSYAADGDIWSVCLGHGSDARKTAHINAPNQWQQAMAVVTIIDGVGSIEPILVNNGKAVFRGQAISGKA